MITKISLVNIYHLTCLQFFFLVVRTSKIYSLSNFETHGTAVLTTVPCCTWHPQHLSPYNWKFLPFDAFTHFSHPPPLTSGNHQSVLYVYGLIFLFLFLDSTYKRSYVFVFLRLIYLT